jgi:hypothetical protein
MAKGSEKVGSQNDRLCPCNKLGAGKEKKVMCSLPGRTIWRQMCLRNANENETRGMALEAAGESFV